MTQKLSPIYGSDPNGLVWGYRFSPCQPGQPITAEEGLELLSSPEFTRQREFIWLHFSLSNSASELWLKRNLALPESFYESLHTDIRSTRLEQDGDSLVAVIYDVLFDFKFDASDISTASLFIESHLLISARLRPLRSVDELRVSVRSEKVFQSTVALLAHLFEKQAGVLVNILRHSTSLVDKIEDRLLANRIAVSRTELGSIRRVLVRLQRLLAPEPAALFRLLNQPPEWIVDNDIQALQQIGEEFSAVVGDTTTLIERVKLLQEELSALVNERTNNTLYVLTIVTVLALPINLVGSLFGMNVGGIPLTNNEHGFLIIVGIMLSLTIFLGYMALGRKRDI